MWVDTKPHIINDIDKALILYIPSMISNSDCKDKNNPIFN
jgi:hypothetical protein